MPGSKEIVMNFPLKKNENGKFYIPTEINYLWDPATYELEEVFDNK